MSRRAQRSSPQPSTALAVRPKPLRRAIRLGLTERGRLRRQVRFLRKQRELQMRDLGGLIFDMYRFGSKRQDLVREKLRLMFEADRELRAFEAMLGGRRGPLDVREPGVGGSCPRCLTLYSTDAHYCWRCGLALTAAAETEHVVDVDVREPTADDQPVSDPLAPEPVAPDPGAVTEGPSANGAAEEQLTTEIDGGLSEGGQLSSRPADASHT